MFDDSLKQQLQRQHRPLGIRNKAYLIFNGPGSWPAFAAALFFIFSLLADLHGSYLDYFAFSGSQLQHTRGSVIDTFDTNLEVNERTVNGIVFSYAVDGINMQNTSFAREWYPRPQSSVQVEYLQNDPSIARISKTTYSKFGLFALILFVLACGAMIIAVIRFKKSLSWISLLQRGKCANAKLTSQKPTNVTINGERVMALEFALTDDSGKQRHWTVRTYRPDELTDDALELALYHPNKPSSTPVLLDQLPVRLQENSNHWAPLPMGKLLFALLIKLGIPLLLIWLFFL